MKVYIMFDVLRFKIPQNVICGSKSQGTNHLVMEAVSYVI